MHWMFVCLLTDGASDPLFLHALVELLGYKINDALLCVMVNAFKNKMSFLCFMSLVYHHNPIFECHITSILFEP